MCRKLDRLSPGHRIQTNEMRRRAVRPQSEDGLKTQPISALAIGGSLSLGLVLAVRRRCGRSSNHADCGGSAGNLADVRPKVKRMSEILIASEVAELLHCTAERVEELARAGEIPGLKIGRNWLFVRVDLLSYLAERAREEAHARRMKRQPHAPLPKARPRRQIPPALPTRGR